MGYSSQEHKLSPEPDNLGVEEEQFANAQESVPIPLVCGVRKIAVRWISRVYNQYAKEAPQERPAKK